MKDVTQKALQLSSSKLTQALYNHNIQMSLGQVQAIVAAIRASGPECKLLIFGCGNDSDFWHAVNATGKTVFLENHARWLAKAKKRNPSLDIRQVDYGHRTVENSLPIDEPSLRLHPMPQVMLEEAWDVVIIDSPMGYRKSSPGRALPIYWTSAVATPRAHIFVDDYERKLERKYADHFLNARRTWYSIVPRQVKGSSASAGEMLWSIGDSLGAPAPKSASNARGAVIFLLDSRYIAGLKTLAYTLRHAIAAATHDIVVVTNDDAVASSEVVRSIANRIELLTDDDITNIQRVNSTRVSGNVRHMTVGKYTFLKFFSFRDIGYDHHIFLDVDMLCLDPNFRFTDLVGDYDFAAAPTMGRKFLSIEKGDEAEDGERALLNRVTKALERRYNMLRSFNSGVFFAGRNLLGDRSVERLIAIGADVEAKLEQTITARLVSTTPGLQFEPLSARLNFPEGAARAIGRANFDDLKKQIVFLHYNNPGKPWEKEDAGDWLAELWREQAKQADQWWLQRLSSGG